MGNAESSRKVVGKCREYEKRKIVSLLADNAMKNV